MCLLDQAPDIFPLPDVLTHTLMPGHAHLLSSMQAGRVKVEEDGGQDVVQLVVNQAVYNIRHGVAFLAPAPAAPNSASFSIFVYLTGQCVL